MLTVTGWLRKCTILPTIWLMNSPMPPHTIRIHTILQTDKQKPVWFNPTHRKLEATFQWTETKKYTVEANPCGIIPPAVTEKNWNNLTGWDNIGMCWSSPVIPHGNMPFDWSTEKVIPHWFDSIEQKLISLDGGQNIDNGLQTTNFKKHGRKSLLHWGEGIDSTWILLLQGTQLFTSLWLVKSACGSKPRGIISTPDPAATDTFSAWTVFSDCVKIRPLSPNRPLVHRPKIAIHRIFLCCMVRLHMRNKTVGWQDLSLRMSLHLTQQTHEACCFLFLRRNIIKVLHVCHQSRSTSTFTRTHNFPWVGFDTSDGPMIVMFSFFGEKFFLTATLPNPTVYFPFLKACRKLCSTEKSAFDFQICLVFQKLI